MGRRPPALGMHGRALGLFQGPKVLTGSETGTHRREGGGRGGGSSPANTGVDMWRDRDLKRRQGLPETRMRQPGSQLILPVTSWSAAKVHL